MVLVLAEMGIGWRGKWFFRPRQGIGMTVAEYYTQFYDWKEEMITLSFPAKEDDYIDGFIEYLGWDIRLRLSKSKHRRNWSRLNDAFSAAKFEESMMLLEVTLKKFEAHMVFDELPSRISPEFQQCELLDSVWYASNEMAEPLGDEDSHSTMESLMQQPEASSNAESHSTVAEVLEIDEILIEIPAEEQQVEAFISSNPFKGISVDNSHAIISEETTVFGQENETGGDVGNVLGKLTKSFPAVVDEKGDEFHDRADGILVVADPSDSEDKAHKVFTEMLDVMRQPHSLTIGSLKDAPHMLDEMHKRSSVESDEEMLLSGLFKTSKRVTIGFANRHTVQPFNSSYVPGEYMVCNHLVVENCCRLFDPGGVVRKNEYELLSLLKIEANNINEFSVLPIVKLLPTIFIQFFGGYKPSPFWARLCGKIRNLDIGLMNKEVVPILISSLHLIDSLEVINGCLIWEASSVRKDMEDCEVIIPYTGLDTLSLGKFESGIRCEIDMQGRKTVDLLLQLGPEFRMLNTYGIGLLYIVWHSVAISLYYVEGMQTVGWLTWFLFTGNEAGNGLWSARVDTMKSSKKDEECSIELEIVTSQFSTVVVAKMPNFVWDPGQNGISLCILVDKDVLERVGKDVVLMDTILEINVDSKALRKSNVCVLEQNVVEMNLKFHGLFIMDLGHLHTSVKECSTWEHLVNEVLTRVIKMGFILMNYLDGLCGMDLYHVNKPAEHIFCKDSRLVLVNGLILSSLFLVIKEAELQDCNQTALAGLGPLLQMVPMGVIKVNFQTFVWDPGLDCVSFRFSTLRTRCSFRGGICHDIAFYYKFYMYFRIFVFTYLARYDVIH